MMSIFWKAFGRTHKSKKLWYNQIYADWSAIVQLYYWFHSSWLACMRDREWEREEVEKEEKEWENIRMLGS